MTGTPAPLRFFLEPKARERGLGFCAPRPGDAGYDLRAADDLVLPPGKQVLIPTGLKLAIPEGWVGIVKDRSSMASKRIYTHAGVIDSSYRGEVKVLVSNQSTESFQVQCGDKIAQLVVVQHMSEAQEVSDESDLGNTARGAGGFGSTGAR